jgi:hypothetical protein
MWPKCQYSVIYVWGSECYDADCPEWSTERVAAVLKFAGTGRFASAQERFGSQLMPFVHSSILGLLALHRVRRRRALVHGRTADGTRGTSDETLACGTLSALSLSLSLD